MTGLLPRQIPNRHCSPHSTRSMAVPAAPNRLELPGQFWLYHRLREPPDQLRTRTDDDKQNTADRHRTLRLLGALAGSRSCWVRAQIPAEKSWRQTVPNDYRQRHPIAIQDRPLDRHFRRSCARRPVRSQRPTLWAGTDMGSRRTGAIVADVPVDTPNARAAADFIPSTRHCLRQAVHAEYVAPLPSDDFQNVRTIRLSLSMRRRLPDRAVCGQRISDLDREPGYG